MNVGTKSVLFGAHAFYLHPWFVAWGWWKLYGFPWDPRLWVAFFVHDLGYWGKPNMDGEEGETHPFFGARVMTWLFDRDPKRGKIQYSRNGGQDASPWMGEWGQFVLFHSRFLAKRYGPRPSRLCIADKLAICLTPAWLYLPMVRATGEIDEYRSLAATDGYENLVGVDEEEWFQGVKDYLRTWIEEHKDGRPDTWSERARIARDNRGVHK